MASTVWFCNVKPLKKTAKSAFMEEGEPCFKVRLCKCARVDCGKWAHPPPRELVPNPGGALIAPVPRKVMCCDRHPRVCFGSEHPEGQRCAPTAMRPVLNEAWAELHGQNYAHLLERARANGDDAPAVVGCRGRGGPMPVPRPLWRMPSRNMLVPHAIVRAGPMGGHQTLPHPTYSAFPMPSPPSIPSRWSLRL